ncbi:MULTISPECIES: hypothetical protein [unclassified Pseudomonas]|nr:MULTISPECIES: hypothetical protein [unclassified Pseudomonas]
MSKLAPTGVFLGKSVAFAQWLKQTLPEQACAPSATRGLDDCSF